LLNVCPHLHGVEATLLRQSHWQTPGALLKKYLVKSVQVAAVFLTHWHRLASQIWSHEHDDGNGALAGQTHLQLAVSYTCGDVHVGYAVHPHVAFTGKVPHKQLFCFMHTQSQAEELKTCKAEVHFALGSTTQSQSLLSNT